MAKKGKRKGKGSDAVLHRYIPPIETQLGKTSAQNRFLTIVVKGLNLQTNSSQQNGIANAAPQDAFEVAQRSANTQ